MFLCVFVCVTLQLGVFCSLFKAVTSHGGARVFYSPPSVVMSLYSVKKKTPPHTLSILAQDLLALGKSRTGFERTKKKNSLRCLASFSIY